ncbi:hypothetical protein ABEB36_000013 [Hypothenemus hampei]|uniref:Transposable element P transposase-like RNase H domain-containing protein n=1 Tax=Hypothenemus hampei TaxID=57062 RepID=A0ABD1F9Y7_HYPHA
MSLKSHLFYYISKDEVIGFHQTVNTKSFQLAKNVLVLMARGITSNWKLPVPYFFINSSCPVNELKDIVFKSIKKLKDGELNVLSLISDQETETQINLLKEKLHLFENVTVWEAENNVTKRLKFIYGWKLNISAFLSLWNILKERRVHKVHTRRLNQDCLENFFGKIRLQNGYETEYK